MDELDRPVSRPEDKLIKNWLNDRSTPTPPPKQARPIPPPKLTGGDNAFLSKSAVKEGHSKWSNVK